MSQQRARVTKQTFFNNDDTSSMVPDLFAIRQRAQAKIDGALATSYNGVLALTVDTHRRNSNAKLSCNHYKHTTTRVSESAARCRFCNLCNRWPIHTAVEVLCRLATLEALGQLGLCWIGDGTDLERRTSRQLVIVLLRNCLVEREVLCSLTSVVRW
jgi:hypothetical protein